MMTQKPRGQYRHVNGGTLKPGDYVCRLEMWWKLEEVSLAASFATTYRAVSARGDCKHMTIYHSNHYKSYVSA